MYRKVNGITEAAAPAVTREELDELKARYPDRKV